MLMLDSRAARLEKPGLDLQTTVVALREGLDSFEKGAEQMESIYKRFETRLSHLENEMAPMKDISSKLTVCRRNIGQAVERMEEINEYFLLEGELRGVIEGGIKGCMVGGADSSGEMLGGGVLEYLEEVQRLVKAQSYFRDWPQLVSQAEALKGLNELSDVARKECINEFNQLMGTVGPVVQYRGETNKYEPCEALSETAAYTLEIVGECLTLLGEEDGLMRTYKTTRARTVATSLSLWEERFEGNPAGVDARGDGYWLQMYLDYASKLIEGERALAERALSVGLSKATKGFDKTTTGIGGGNFTGNRSSISAHAYAPASKRELLAEEMFAAVVSPVVKKVVSVVQAKLQSLDTKDGSDKTSGKAKAFGRTGKFDANSQSTDGRGGWSGDIYIEALLSALEMAESFSQDGERLVRTLSEGLCAPTGAGGLSDELLGLGKTLQSSCLQRCIDLLEGVKGDNTSRKNMPENAAVHVLTSNTLRAVKRIVPFRKGFDALVEYNKGRVPWSYKAPSTVDTMGDSGHGVPGVVSADDNGAMEVLPHFVEFVNCLLSALMDNLQQKSMAYDSSQVGSDARRYLFLMNNAYYILATSKHHFEAVDSLRAFGSLSKSPGDIVSGRGGGVRRNSGEYSGGPNPNSSSNMPPGGSQHSYGHRSRASSGSIDGGGSFHGALGLGEAGGLSPMTTESAHASANMSRTSSHTHMHGGGGGGGGGGGDGSGGIVPSPRGSFSVGGRLRGSADFSPRQSLARFSRRAAGGGGYGGGGGKFDTHAQLAAAYASPDDDEGGSDVGSSGGLAVDLGNISIGGGGGGNRAGAATVTAGIVQSGQFVEGGDFTGGTRLSIAMFVTSASLWLLSRSMREKFRNYAECVIQPLVPTVSDDVGPLDFQKKGSTIVNTDCSKKIKGKFSAFNKAWEDAYALHKLLSVSDPTLKEELRTTVKRQLIARYAAMHHKYSEVQFSKKKQFTFYIKYTAAQVEDGIDELFNG